MHSRDNRRKPSQPPRRGNEGFSLLEILIVVLLLGILAAIVLPKFSNASDQARATTLRTDLQTLRQQTTLYAAQHLGRGPHLDEDGALDTNDMLARMLNRTDRDGVLSPDGRLGPYVYKWPANPFANPSVSALVSFGTDPQPPRDNSTGWYYCTATCLISANSPTGGEDMDP